MRRAGKQPWGIFYVLNSTGEEYAVETKTHLKPHLWSRVMSSAGDQSCSDDQWSFAHPNFRITNVISAMFYHLVTPYRAWYFDNSSSLTGSARVWNGVHFIENNDTGFAQHIENF